MVKKIITVDLGGTNLRVALVHGNRILKYIKEDTPKSKGELLRILVKNIEGLMSKDIRGIGVSSAGPLINGKIMNPPNLPLKNFDLQGFLKKRFNKKVIVENDANCVALSEAKLGVRKKNFIVLTLGTGVGGGVIINGKLYLGEGFGGELGHIVLDNGKDFEDMWKLQKKNCRKYFGKSLLIKDLLKMDNKNAKQILNESAKYVGQGIGSLINVFDPEVVVLAGGVRETGNVFLNMIRKNTEKYSILPKKTPVAWSKIEHPGTMGASLLI